MFAQLPFFLMLLAASLLLLVYKASVPHFPLLIRPWWSYRYTIVVLAVASWVFIYQDDWGIPLDLFVLDYCLFISVRLQRTPKWLAVLLSVAPLLIVKTHMLSFVSVMGLSFITFRAVDALLMNDLADSADIGEYFLYLFFPPALLAGPMYRWRDFRRDLSTAYAQLSVASILGGWEYLILGIVQKFALAQLVDTFVVQRFAADDYSIAAMGCNAVGYSVFLYFDFAGYSNMAIGAARIFGFTLPDNFKNPILTTNPQDFWKRWHVSLSEWLRDMVFTPLYKYLVAKKSFASNKLSAQNICIFATLFIMGTWNGLETQYISSGALFGLYSVSYNELSHAERQYPALKAFCARAPVRIAGRVLTLALVVLALYVFSGRSPIK